MPCCHAVAAIKRHYDPVASFSVNDYVAHNLTIAAWQATYAMEMPPVEVVGLAPLDHLPCQAPVVLKKIRGRGRLRDGLNAGEQRAAGLNLPLPKRLHRCTRCRQEGHNSKSCRANRGS